MLVNMKQNILNLHLKKNATFDHTLHKLNNMAHILAWYMSKNEQEILNGRKQRYMYA